MKFPSARFLLMFLMLFSGSFSAASAYDDGTNSLSLKDEMSEPSNDLIRNRNYVGGFFSYMGINNDRDFNGTGVEVAANPYELDLIPGINSNFGFGALLGHREGAFALEVSYWRSQHTAYWAPGTPLSSTGTATYQSVDIDLKRYICTEQFIQPFFQVGMALPWTTYPLASTDGLGNFSSLAISGLGFNAGGGVEFYVDDAYSIFGGVRYRWATFDHAYGARKVEWSIIVPLEGDGLNFYAGGTMKLW